MLGNILSSLLLAASLGAATVRLPVAPCMLSNTPATRACLPESCANKICCETSLQRTSAPSQSLVKSDASQEISAVPLLAVARPLPLAIPVARQTLLPAPTFALPPPARVLLCTFLI